MIIYCIFIFIFIFENLSWDQISNVSYIYL